MCFCISINFVQYYGAKLFLWTMKIYFTLLFTAFFFCEIYKTFFKGTMFTFLTSWKLFHGSVSVLFNVSNLLLSFDWKLYFLSIAHKHIVLLSVWKKRRPGFFPIAMENVANFMNIIRKLLIQRHFCCSFLLTKYIAAWIYAMR